MKKIQEAIPVISTPEVTPHDLVQVDDLKKISHDIWGTDIYGDTAANFVAEPARLLDEATVMTFPDNDKTVRAISWRRFRIMPVRTEEEARSRTVGSYPVHLRDESPPFNVEKAQVETMLRKGWPEMPYPFESPTAVFKSHDPEDDSIDWDLAAGPTTVNRLAHYAQVSGIAESEMQGSIGKAFGVIKVAAQLATAEAVAAQHPELDMPFVDFEEFLTGLREADMKGHVKKRIRDAINTILGKHITGGPVYREYNDIIVEGAGGWVTRGGSRVARFEKIALHSLAHLLDHEPETRHTAARAYLAQFAVD